MLLPYSRAGVPSLSASPQLLRIISHHFIGAFEPILSLLCFTTMQGQSAMIAFEEIGSIQCDR